MSWILLRLLSLFSARNPFTLLRWVDGPVVDPKVLRDQHISAVEFGFGAEFLSAHLGDQEKSYDQVLVCSPRFSTTYTYHREMRLPTSLATQVAPYQAPFA